MALSPADFVLPKGELSPEMFPGVGDLAEEGGYVDTWLAEAQEKTGDEKAQAAWVYYRAFSAVANRLNANPASVDVEHKGSKQRLISQMQYFEQKAAEYRAEFERLTETAGKTSNFRVRSPARPGDGRGTHPEYYSGRR